MNLVCYLTISLVVLFTKHISSTTLPIWAKRRKQCPEAENETAWILAATKLDCLHPKDSKLRNEQDRVYHCLPSSLLNEYVEFCGINLPIEPGYCPVFKYVDTNGRNRGPNYMNCSSFQIGCPKKQYFSKNVYKYPDCLAIYKIDMCYTADVSCPRVVVTESRKNPGILRSLFLSTTDSSVKINDNDITDANDGWIVLLVAIFLSITIITVLIYVLYAKRWKRKRVFKGKGINAETFFRERFKDQCEDEETAFLVNDEVRKIQLKILLYEIADELLEWDVEKLKYFLRTNDRENFEDTNTKIDQMDKLKILEHMDSIFHLDLNIYILEGYMENIKKKKLAEKCIKFAQNSAIPLIYYVRQSFFPGCTEILVKVDRDLVNFTRVDLETIVTKIQFLLNARRDQIILYGISVGCIQLHLAVQNVLLPRLRTSNLHSLHKYQVFKVSIREECIYHCSDFDLKHQTEYHSKENYALFPPRNESNFYVSLTDGGPGRSENENFYRRMHPLFSRRQTEFVPACSSSSLVKGILRKFSIYQPEERLSYLAGGSKGRIKKRVHQDQQNIKVSQCVTGANVIPRVVKGNFESINKIVNMDECSFVSLRDVERVQGVMSWFYRQSQGETNPFDLMEEEEEEEADSEKEHEEKELGVSMQQMVSIECSPLCELNGIVGTFRQCAMYQKDKDLNRFVSVVVLDEVGLAEDSPKMPLKILHSLLEVESQENEKPEEYKKVAFIGISNWALDPAKMNRGILVQREVPDLIELKEIANLYGKHLEKKYSRKVKNRFPYDGFLRYDVLQTSNDFAKHSKKKEDSFRQDYIIDETLGESCSKSTFLGRPYQMNLGTFLQQQKKSEFREMTSKPIGINSTLNDISSNTIEKRASDIDVFLKNIEKTTDDSFSVGARGIDDGKIDKEHDLRTQNYLRDLPVRIYKYSELCGENIISKEILKSSPPTRIKIYSEVTELFKKETNEKKDWKARTIETIKAIKEVEERIKFPMYGFYKEMKARIFESKIKREIKREMLQTHTQVSGLQMPYSTVKDISSTISACENAMCFSVVYGTIAKHFKPNVSLLLSAGCSFAFAFALKYYMWRFLGPNDRNAQREFTKSISGSLKINNQFNIFSRSFQHWYHNISFFFSEFIRNKLLI